MTKYKEIAISLIALHEFMIATSYLVIFSRLNSAGQLEPSTEYRYLVVRCPTWLQCHWHKHYSDSLEYIVSFLITNATTANSMKIILVILGCHPHVNDMTGREVSGGRF